MKRKQYCLLINFKIYSKMLVAFRKMILKLYEKRNEVYSLMISMA